MDWVILGGSLGPRLSAEMLLRPTSLGERFMGCTVPVPVFANMPVGTSTLQRRIEMWPSPHSRAAAHLRAGRSRTRAEWLLTSAVRASAGVAASMWHKACTQSFFSLLKKSTKKVPHVFARGHARNVQLLSHHSLALCGAGFFSFWQYMLLSKCQG